MEKIALLFNCLSSKLLKIPGQYRIACQVQGVGGECAISGPYIGVGIPGEVDDIGVIGGDDPALPVNLGA